jgi:hypothetical protein
LGEVAGLPGLADASGEQAVAGEQLRDAAGGGAAEGERDRSGCVSAQVDDVEGQVTDLHGVAVGQQTVRFHRQRLGVDLVRGGRGAGGLGHRLQRLPVVEMLVAGHDQRHLGRVLPNQVDERIGVVGGVDQQGFPGRGTCHQVGVVIHRAD